MKATRARAETVHGIGDSDPAADPERVWAALFAGRQQLLDIRSRVRGIVLGSLFLTHSYRSRRLMPQTIAAYEIWLYSPKGKGATLVGMPVAAYRVGFQFALQVPTSLLSIQIGQAKATLNHYRLADMAYGRSLAGLEQWLLSKRPDGAFSTLMAVVAAEVRCMAEQQDTETPLWLPHHKL